jgi:AcrR family transcriptional regulator
MAGGFATVSIPAVAGEAGVSIPTVYRHFSTKQELLDALYPHALRRTGLGALTPPTSFDELRAGVRLYIQQLDAFDDVTRAAMASPASAEARGQSIARRSEMFRPFVAALEPSLSPSDRDRLVRLMTVLTTSGSLRMWHDHLGLGLEETAREVEWVVRAAIAALRAPKDAAGRIEG